MAKTQSTSQDAISRRLVHSTFHQAIIFKFIHLVFSVTQQSGVKSRMPPPPPTNVVQLDVHNFDSVALVRAPAPFKQMFSNFSF